MLHMPVSVAVQEQGRGPALAVVASHMIGTQSGPWHQRLAAAMQGAWQLDQSSAGSNLIDGKRRHRMFGQ